METLDTQTWIIIAAVVALGFVALGGWLFFQKKQSQKLQEHFGPEYDRTVSELGSRTKGESELKAREKRVDRLDILPLAPSEGARFTEAWQALQSRFFDNPKGGGEGGSKILLNRGSLILLSDSIPPVICRATGISPWTITRASILSRARSARVRSKTSALSGTNRTSVAAPPEK